VGGWMDYTSVLPGACSHLGIIWLLCTGQDCSDRERLAL